MGVLGTRRHTPSARRRVLFALTVVCAATHAAILSVGLRHVPTSGEAHAPGSFTVRAIALPAEAARALATEPQPQRAASLARPERPVAVFTAPSPSATPAVEAAPPAVDTAIAAPVTVEAFAPVSATRAPEHLATAQLDMPPLPRSAPDASVVAGALHTGQPIRLRLYIETDGMVSAVEMLSVNPLDEPAAERLIAMFRGTAFVPGRLQGRDVPTFMDVEILSLPHASSLHSD